jgi:hypothetical protein
MPDTNRNRVLQRLERLGFEVEVLAEGRRPTPDLVAYADGVSMHVEVKTRFEDRKLREQMESVRLHEMRSFRTAIKKTNPVSALIRSAARQLAAGAMPEQMRLLWVRAENALFLTSLVDQIGAAVYGIRFVEVSVDPRPRACLYAHHADFFRFPDIDGTVVEDAEGLLTLLLNPFSPRKTQFVQSRIAVSLAPSVFDPDTSARDGHCFIAGPDAPRDDDAELLQHLRLRYPGIDFARFVEPATTTVVTTLDGRTGIDTISSK